MGQQVSFFYDIVEGSFVNGLSGYCEVYMNDELLQDRRLVYFRVKVSEIEYKCLK